MDKSSKGGEKSDVNKEKRGCNIEKSYFDVLGLCCSSEVPLIEKILKPLEGVVEVSVIVPSRTVIVVHDILLISQHQIVKALNQARLEANVRVIGKASYRGKWPSPYVIASGLLLSLSFLKYVYHPFQWLAVAAVAVGIWPILMRGVIAIRNFTLDVNILMLIAVVGTLVMRDYTEAGTIVFLFTIAEWLESRASQKATAVMSSLLSMTPQQATIAETGEVVNVKDVKLSTVLAVKSGELIPIDGVVAEGTCEVDEKTLTGESYPVPKQKDSTVWAGTVNVNGYVSVKTTALAEDCAVAKMAKLVEEAQNNKSSVQRLIDRCAKYYTPAVVLISAGIAVVPVAMKLHDKKHWFYLSLVVLVSACPCGLILSTPVATFCALSRAATSGLLIKGGDYLEILAKIKHIAFDKTGTITRGEFTLKDFRSLADDVTLTTLVYWVSSIESKSSHPIAAVLADYGRPQGIEPKPENVEDFQNFPGEGVFGKIDGREIYIGNQKLGRRANCTVASNIVHGDDSIKEARTCGYVYSGGVLIGTFSLSDDCRSGAAEAIRELKSMGIKTALLTGDTRSTAMRAQEQLGKTLDAVHADLLPEDKARIIKDYKKDGPTAMVGDGVNDAPALATADVGISMGVSGSALATETGHVVLMSNDIRKIPKAIKLARKTRRKVIENIFISIITKAGVIAFAIAGHPLVWLAVLADVATCLVVIFNSMLLLRGSSHTHGSSRCFGMFSSCHSHKTELHHSKTSQQCCSKTAVPHCSATPCHTAKPKSCGSSKCSSQSHSATPCLAINTKACGPAKCYSQSHSATPCQTTNTKSCGPVRCSSQSHSAIPCQPTDTKSCGPAKCSSQSQLANPCQTTNPDSCESAKCSESCAPACQTTGSTSYSSVSYVDPIVGAHVSECCQPTNQPHCHADVHDTHDKHCHSADAHDTHDTHCHSADAHDTHEKHCHSPERASECESNDPHSSSCCEGNVCSDDDHCLDLLESQASSCIKHDHLDSAEHHHLGVHAHHHSEQKSSCCEVNDGTNKLKCLDTKEISPVQSSSVIDVLHSKHMDSKHEHCSKSHDVHVTHHHHHHHRVLSHGSGHANAVAKHACSSLRKREVGACCKSFRKECCSGPQGHIGPAFGGLTEIVTE
ncbi:cadmium/zinc-transporting ATPase HMA3-like isoform X1 [Chenopodium quinoa]|uniref:HMA domain-containing protein n=2 Tax=Chenopodium quinoa TaxID=63459 RepID=A0A803MPQ5_CHEQI|nr:cadmium/zinc-transporting ATPase HMA3-like isoform X1 [Chenopodium quinoa]